MPIWSIVIGILTTAIEWTFSLKSDDLELNKDNKSGDRSVDEKSINHAKKSTEFSVSLKGVNKMTILFAAFMVSVGVLGRDSNDVLSI